MEMRAPALKDRIKRLRRTYLEKLPETVNRIRALLVRLRTAPDEESIRDDLYRLFHNIKGSAASFGLDELSQGAAAGENVIRAWRETSPHARDATLNALEGCVTRLEMLSFRLHTDAPDLLNSFESPPFEIAPPGCGCDDGNVCYRVYICDDEEEQAQQLATQIACFGYVVRVYPDPESLREAVIREAPNAIIMDIMFPGKGIDGTTQIDTIKRIREPAPAIIFLSARRDFDARLKSVLAGGKAYFKKPVSVTELVDTLDNLTARHQPEPFRVLIIDDEPEVATFHSLILEQAGMQTRLLYQPDKVLETLAEYNPDLVLMDMYMPECSGRDLSQLIRQVPDFIGLPIVFLSSETDKITQVSALRVGAEGFLTKPIQPEDLISAVALRAERMRILRSLMTRDSLTGLFNHTACSQFLESLLSTARRECRPLCLAMIDVDHFKKVNDTYGHPVGDQVLVALSRILRQRLRNSDVVGRYGGEEFAVILPDSTLDQATQVVDQLRQDFARIHFNAGDQEFTCTFSGGVAGFPDYETGATIREAADRMLYAAKRQGRNRIIQTREAV